MPEADVAAAPIAEIAFRGRRKSVPGGCGRGIPAAHAPESQFLRSSLTPHSGRLTVLLATLVVATAAYAAPPPTPPAQAQTAPSQPKPLQPTESQPTQLDAYLDHLKTLRATFLQTLADSQGREIDRATGTIIVQRPGKFSWEIHPQAAGSGGGDVSSSSKSSSSKSGSNSKGSINGSGGSAGQLLVCDGRNLWFFDRDLAQVTVKPVDAALSATPALLLSGAVDVRRNFTITPAGEREGLKWVLVEPHGAEADFREALFGFEKGELKRMILEDKLDQTATVIFDKVERNVPVSSAEVSFTPPPGADVIGKPRQ